MERDTWIRVNGTNVYLDRGALDRGKLVRADSDVLSEQCEGCGEDILETGEVERSTGGRALRVVCSCGAGFPIQRA